MLCFHSFASHREYYPRPHTTLPIGLSDSILRRNNPRDTLGIWCPQHTQWMAECGHVAGVCLSRSCMGICCHQLGIFAFAASPPCISFIAPLASATPPVSPYERPSIAFHCGYGIRHLGASGSGWLCSGWRSWAVDESCIYGGRVPRTGIIGHYCLEVQRTLESSPHFSGTQPLLNGYCAFFK